MAMRIVYVNPGDLIDIRAIVDPDLPRNAAEWKYQTRPQHILLQYKDYKRIGYADAAVYFENSFTDGATAKVEASTAASEQHSGGTSYCRYCGNPKSANCCGSGGSYAAIPASTAPTQQENEKANVLPPTRGTDSQHHFHVIGYASEYQIEAACTSLGEGQGFLMMMVRQCERNVHNVPVYVARRFRTQRGSTNTDSAPASTARDVCAEMRALCSACGGTGEAHSIDGEWRGSCDCRASTAASEKQADDLAWHKESLKRHIAKLESVWEGIREAVQKYSGKPCEGEPFSRLDELLSRLSTAAASEQQAGADELELAVTKQCLVQAQQAAIELSQKLAHAESEMLALTRRATTAADQQDAAQAQAGEDALDAARLDFLDTNVHKFRMGWQVGAAPVGNLSVRAIMTGGQPIREAIDAAMAAPAQRNGGEPAKAGSARPAAAGAAPGAGDAPAPEQG